MNAASRSLSSQLSRWHDAALLTGVLMQETDALMQRRSDLRDTRVALLRDILEESRRFVLDAERDAPKA